MRGYTKNELAFMDELSHHEGQWVGYVSERGRESVRVSGKTFSEAVAAARKKRIMRKVCFMKVPYSDRIFMGAMGRV